MGEPKTKGSKEWRYGRKGSLKIGLPGTDGGGSWYCFESGTSGGVFALIEREAGLSPENRHAAAVKWLRERGLIPAAVERPAKQSPSETNPTSHDDKDRIARDREAKIARSRAIIRASVAGDGTLARRYLAERFAWPPDGTGPDLPASVRWISRDRWPALRPLGKLPVEAAGAIIYRYDDVDGNAVAVDVEPLDKDARILIVNGERRRRTFGSRDSGPLFHAGGDPDGGWSLCEGAVDALACRWRWPVAAAVAVGGSAKLKSVTPAPFAGSSVRIVADGDPAGRPAAYLAGKSLQAAGCEVQEEWCAVGEDPASELADRLRERAAVMEFEGGVDRTDAERAAWAELLYGD